MIEARAGQGRLEGKVSCLVVLGADLVESPATVDKSQTRVGTEC